MLTLSGQKLTRQLNQCPRHSVVLPAETFQCKATELERGAILKIHELSVCRDIHYIANPFCKTIC